MQHITPEEISNIELRGKTKHIRKLMREIRKTDAEFRWLVVLPPVKSNTGKRPYVEYRYLNIKPSKTPELLELRNEYWIKRKSAIIEGYKKADKREYDIVKWHEWKAKKKKFNPEDEK